MKITIKTKNLELTPALKEWIEEKIGGLKKFTDRYESEGKKLCEVEVARISKHHQKGDVFSAEVNLHLPGRDIRVEDQDFDVRVAVDHARDRLQHELVKYKEKGGLTGKALRHMARISKETMRRVMWWREK